MLEKIDKFIDKYFNWKVLLNFVIAELLLIPNALIARKYNVPSLLLIIMNLSFYFGTLFFGKVFKNLFDK